MEPIDNFSATSVNIFNSDSKKTPTQAKIDVEDWGNSFPFIRDPGYTICIFQNIGPQPECGFDAKAHHNKNAFKALGPEVGLFAEHGLNKTKIEAGYTFYKCQQDSIDGTYSYLVNNQHGSDGFSYYQPGGTVFSLDAAFKRKQCAKGRDISGLGRWCWTCLQGRDDSYVRFVSAYRPCVNKKGLNSVYNQQFVYF